MSTCKKFKAEPSFHPEPGPKTYETACKELNLDLKKLEGLVDYAVRVTSRSSGKTAIKLYEELEIISLRYASTWDRSKLPEVKYFYSFFRRSRIFFFSRSLPPFH